MSSFIHGIEARGHRAFVLVCRTDMVYGDLFME